MTVVRPIGRTSDDPLSIFPVSGNASRKYWYAAAARAVVKEERSDSHRPLTSTELVSFQLQP